MKASERDLLSLAFSTRSSTLEAVDSPNDLVTRARTTPETLTQPESSSSPTPAGRGMDSPVSAMVSRLVSPSSTTPSSGTRSPGLTTMVSPTRTSAGLTTFSAPSRTTVATSGRMSMRCEMERSLRSSAMSSKSSPTWKKSITKTASANSGSDPGRKPIARAPMVAIAIRKSSSNGSPSRTPSHASASTS